MASPRASLKSRAFCLVSQANLAWRTLHFTFCAIYDRGMLRAAAIVDVVRLPSRRSLGLEEADKNLIDSLAIRNELKLLKILT